MINLVKEFEFASRKPIDECIRDLNAINPQRRSFVAGMNDRIVFIEPDSNDGYRFRLHQDRAKRSVVLRGTLTYSRDNLTLVRGEVYVNLLEVVVIVAVCFICSIVMISSIILKQYPSLGVAVMGLAFFSILVSTFRERERLTKIVYDTLSDQIY